MRESSREAMRRKILAFGAALVLALAACSGGGRSAAPTTTAAPPPTTAVAPSPPTTADPNPDVIPAVITVPYVNAVFVVLNHLNGDAARSLIASGHITSEVENDLRAIYDNPLFSIEMRVAEQGVGSRFANVRRPPGDRLTTVTHLITGTKGCIFVETRTDLSAVEVVPTSPAASEYWELRPKQSGIDPENHNRTPWALAFNQAYLTPTAVTNPCSA